MSAYSNLILIFRMFNQLGINFNSRDYLGINNIINFHEFLGNESR